MIDEQPTADPVPADTARSKWASTPLGIAITTIGIGSLIGLVGWPRPTAYALCALTGALALVAGILRLRGELTHQGDPLTADDATPERCCVCGSPETPYENYRGQLFCWPCANGDRPLTGADTGSSKECAGCAGCGGPDCIGRPDLVSLLGRKVTVSGPANATWRGQLIALADHPTLMLEEAPGVAVLLPQAYRVEVIEERPYGAPTATVEHLDEQQLCHDIAAALRADLQRRTIPPITDYAGRPISSTGFGLTPHDLAETALNVVRPHLATPAAQDADTIAAIQAKQTAARRMSCGHDATSSCPECDEAERAWRTELAAAYWDLQLAVAHDRQAYPTAAAYTATCAALSRHRERADRAEQALATERAARTSLDQALQRVRADCDVVRRAADERAGEYADQLARVAERCQQIRDRVGLSGMINASQVLGLLSPTWPDGNYESSPHGSGANVVQAATEQPVSDPPPTVAVRLDNTDATFRPNCRCALTPLTVPVSEPQPVDESDPDTCQVVHVDGGPVRIHGQGEMDEKTARFFAEIVQAGKRKYAAEHPDEADPGTTTVPLDWRSTSTFRRLAAGLTGIVRDHDGSAICTCTFEVKCPACLATDSDG